MLARSNGRSDSANLAQFVRVIDKLFVLGVVEPALQRCAPSRNQPMSKENNGASCRTGAGSESIHAANLPSSSMRSSGAAYAAQSDKQRAGKGTHTRLKSHQAGNRGLLRGVSPTMTLAAPGERKCSTSQPVTVALRCADHGRVCCTCSSVAALAPAARPNKARHRQSLTWSLNSETKLNTNGRAAARSNERPCQAAAGPRSTITKGPIPKSARFSRDRQTNRPAHPWSRAAARVAPTRARPAPPGRAAAAPRGPRRTAAARRRRSASARRRSPPPAANERAQRASANERGQQTRVTRAKPRVQGTLPKSAMLRSAPAWQRPITGCAQQAGQGQSRTVPKGAKGGNNTERTAKKAMQRVRSSASDALTLPGGRSRHPAREM